MKIPASLRPQETQAALKAAFVKMASEEKAAAVTKASKEAAAKKTAAVKKAWRRQL